mmetsp:Transcript_96613/g.208457  ORF Transcript_96613/g.208457 Transcript_96613/m.208457 type:complete len:89 (-) Transcript_96613:578-844(-)
MQKAVVGINHEENKSEVSPAIELNLQLLKHLDSELEAVDPLPSQGRYGNRAFKTFHDKFDESVDPLIKQILELGTDVNVDEVTYELRG